MSVCGRPTKAGTPCKALGFNYAGACKVHETLLDRQLNQAFNDGRNVGEEQSKRSAEWKFDSAVHAEVARRMLEKPCKHWRFRDIAGRQIITVGNYAYAWSGSEDLKVGDDVKIPASEWYPASVQHVTQIGTDYVGPLRVI